MVQAFLRRSIIVRLWSIRGWNDDWSHIAWPLRNRSASLLTLFSDFVWSELRSHVMGRLKVFIRLICSMLSCVLITIVIAHIEVLLDLLFKNDIGKLAESWPANRYILGPSQHLYVLL